MVSLAARNLQHEGAKVAFSTCAVALISLFILTIAGLYNGIDTLMERVVMGTGADFWITMEGTSGSLHSPSILSLTLLPALRRVDGVYEVTPLVRTAVVYPTKRRNLLIVVNGYDVRGRLGAPPKVVAGRSTPATGEVLIDEEFARLRRLSLGDSITLGRRAFRVVGLTADTNIMIGYIVSMTYADAALFLVPGMANSFLVKVRRGADLDDVRQAMTRALTGIEVKTSPEVVRAYTDEVLGSFRSVILVLTVMAFLVGLLVIGLHIYTLTVEKSREYGMVKAIGATNLYLYRVVAGQTLLISGGGFASGAAISAPVISVISGALPEFIVILTPGIVAGVFGLFMIAGLCASLIPLRRIASIDPAVAFRA